MSDEGLDRERVEQLTQNLLLSVRENYQRGPMSRDRVFEALNALAAATALVLAGANDQQAKNFFLAALEVQTKDLIGPVSQPENDRI